MASSLYKAQEALRTCDYHLHEELSCYCETCKKIICTKCAKTEHSGHDWDFIPLVAKKRRKETPLLCRKIKQEELPWCREKLRAIDDNISAGEKASDEDVKMLEERRTVITGMVNQMFDEKKEKREEIKREESIKMKEERHKMRTKIEYLDKMTSSLDSNIGAYNDYDVIEMTQKMLTVLREVDSIDVIGATTLMFVPGDINQEAIEEMIGAMVETMLTHGNISAKEMKSFKELDEIITVIAPISHTEAWIGDDESTEVTLLSLHDTLYTKSITLPTHADFISLSNGDFIVTDDEHQVIRRVTSAGKVSVISRTKPLDPAWISKTNSDDILVSLMDSDDYQLHPYSRRLVRRMTLEGNILHTYEFREDGTTKLFVFPWKTSENGNSDICVINRISDVTGELIVLYGDGRMKFTYRGQEGSEFGPSGVACDYKRRIIVSDVNTRSLHLLSQDGAILRHLLSDMLENPSTLMMYKNNLWIGFRDGTVKVYKYIVIKIYSI